MKKILLVEPEFPIAAKSKNHANFLPVGLLKLAAYFRARGNKVQLVRGNEVAKFSPDKIYITSLFTYWAKQVGDSIKYYRQRYPSAKIIVGGVLASLMPKHCKSLGCNSVYKGIHKQAEKYSLIHGAAYDLVDKYGVDYQVVHAMRGCVRRCSFCGTWKIEEREDVSVERLVNNIVICGTQGVIGENKRNKVIFYDNNFLAHKNINELLERLAKVEVNNRRILCESQSGFDGRLLTLDIAHKLKKARFINPRIAWDNGYGDYKEIEKQINLLVAAGYRRKEMYVFMIYNYIHNYSIMEKKRKKCRCWGVQIADCRYRPLDQIFDNYKPRAEQTINDYHIHPNWTDKKIKQFRKNVREQNICVRQNLKEYKHELEVWGRERRKAKTTRKSLVETEETAKAYIINKNVKISQKKMVLV